MADNNSGDTFSSNNFQNRNNSQTGQRSFRNESQQRNSYLTDNSQGNLRNRESLLGSHPMEGQQNQRQNYPQFGNIVPPPNMFPQQGFQMSNFSPGLPTFPTPPHIGKNVGNFFGGAPGYQGHGVTPEHQNEDQGYQRQRQRHEQIPFRREIPHHQSGQSDHDVHNNQDKDVKGTNTKEDPKMAKDKLKLLSKLGGFLNFTEYQSDGESDDENKDVDKIMDDKDSKTIESTSDEKSKEDDKSDETQTSDENKKSNESQVGKETKNVDKLESTEEYKDLDEKYIAEFRKDPSSPLLTLPSKTADAVESNPAVIPPLPPPFPRATLTMNTPPPFTHQGTPPRVLPPFRQMTPARNIPPPFQQRHPVNTTPPFQRMPPPVRMPLPFQPVQPPPHIPPPFQHAVSSVLPPLSQQMNTPPPFQQPSFQMNISPHSQPVKGPLSIRETRQSSYFTTDIENIPTPSQPYPNSSNVGAQNSLLNSPSGIPAQINESHVQDSGKLSNLPSLPSSSPLKLTTSMDPSKLSANIELPPHPTLRIEKSAEKSNVILNPSSGKKNLLDDSQNKEVKTEIKDKLPDKKKDKPDVSQDKISMAIKKQEIEVISGDSADVLLAKLETAKEKEISKQKLSFQSRKLNLPLLGKANARKLLRSYSASTALLKEKERLKNEESEEKKAVTAEFADDEKKEGGFKKKKKHEKISFIEQIKEEETRIKEALHMTNSMFSSYGFGLGTLEINNFFDNPEALKKFQARGKSVVDKIEKGELVSPMFLQSTNATKESEPCSKSSHLPEESLAKLNEDSFKKERDEEERKEEEGKPEREEGKRKRDEEGSRRGDEEGKSQRGDEEEKSRRGDEEGKIRREDEEEKLQSGDEEGKILRGDEEEKTQRGEEEWNQRLDEEGKYQRGYAEGKSQRDEDGKSRRDEEGRKGRDKGRSEEGKRGRYEGGKRGRDEEERRERDREDKRSIKISESETPKHKSKDVPTSWGEMKKRNMKMIDLWRIIDNARRKSSQFSSPSKDKNNDVNKLAPFPDLPKRFPHHFKVSGADGYSSKQFTGSLVQYTETKPSISYSVDSKKYKYHYWTRREIKIKNRNNSGIMTIVEGFWDLEPDLKRKRLPAQRNWWSDNYLMETLSEDEEEEKEEEEKEDRERNESALDYLSSSYKTADSIDQDEEMEDLSSVNEDSPFVLKDADEESEEEISKFDFETSFSEVTKLDSPNDIKLSAQELNEEYEAFINTLEYKPEESLSEDTLDLNSSLLSFDDIQEDSNKMEDTLIKEPKITKKSSLPYQPKSVKEIKQLLLDSKLTKKQRKELKRLKKTLKSEKKERKKLKRELKKKRKVEKKLKKKQEKRKGKVEQIQVVSTRDAPKSDTHFNEETYVVDEWEEEYNVESVIDITSPEKKLENEDFSDTSGFHEQSQFSESPLTSSSTSVFSYKSIEETSNASKRVEETQDRYSPSNMSVCSAESPNAVASPDLYTFDKVQVTSERVASPYSPSSPQSSASDSEEKAPVNSITSLDAIPLPTMQTLSLTSDKSGTGFSAFKPVANITESSTINTEEKPQVEEDQETPFKKTFQPVVFKLGSKKQTAGLKLLQKAPLPGFAEIEEEDERRSPMVDLHEGGASKVDKLKSPLVENSFPTKPTGIDEDKAKESTLKEVETKNTSIDSQHELIAEKGDKPSLSVKEEPESSSKDSDKETKRSSSKRSSSKESDSSGFSKELSKAKSSDVSKSSKKNQESESKKEKENKTGLEKDNKAGSNKSSSSDKYRDRRSPSPRRKKERRREGTPESRRRRHSRSPQVSRRNYRSRSRSPRVRSDRPRYYSPESRGDKGRDSRRDSRSRSPSPKWKRIKSPPPKRYKESSEWSHGEEDKRRSYRDEERSPRASYSPRNKGRSSSSLDSPKNRPRIASPEYDSKDTDRFSPKPINSISTRRASSDAPEHWDWVDSSKTFYPNDDLETSPSPQDSKERSCSPSGSPKRLSLDERLKQEHGVEVNESQVRQEEYPRQGYYWEYNPPPSLPVSHQDATGKPQVIRVGNVLQVLPQDSSPVRAPEEPTFMGIPVPPPSIPPTGIPSLGIPPPSLPKIVQTGNVIQVVPADPFPTSAIIDASKADLHAERQELSVVSLATGVVTSSSVITPAEIAPVPPPSTTPSNPLAFISSLLASSMSKPMSLSASTVTTTPTLVVSSSPAVQLMSPQETFVARREEMAKPVEIIPGLDNQQQQAIISAAVAAAASGVTASNLPIAHLISVLQQQSLLNSQSISVQPEVNSISNVSELQPEAETEPLSELQPQIDLETFKQQRKERKERKRKERELRRQVRREKAIQKKLEQQQKMEQKMEEKMDAYDEDDALLKEAMTEVPELGSPMPDYEVYNDDDFLDEDEEDEMKKSRFLPLPNPPEKGILIGPTYRIVKNKENERKTVSFADGVMPGYGTSPSGGEEIHSPPPQLYPEKEKKKKLRKKKKVKVRIIKQYVLGDTRMDSPPPPPDTAPTAGTLKLYPGCTHYTLTAPGTFVIYTQQPVKVNGASPGLAIGSTVTIPPGMLIHSSALSKKFATEGGGVGVMNIPPPMPSAFPDGYPTYYIDSQLGGGGDQSVMESPARN